MQTKSFKELLAAELQTLLSIEKEALKGIPSLKKAIFTRELTEVLETDLKRIRQSVASLKAMMRDLDGKGKAHPDEAVKGMLSAGSFCLEHYPKGTVRDAALLALFQRMGNYRAAVYASTFALAKQMGEQAVMEVLKEASTAEDLSVKRLAQIAVQVNAEAYIDSDSERCIPSVPPENKPG